MYKLINFYIFVDIINLEMRICILLIMMLGAQPPDSIMVAFWNMENFYDPFVDSTRVYNEFTEQGSQHWTKSRFYKKRNNLYKAILAFSQNKAIGIMGVCEVENEFVLNALFAQTPLKKFNYRWVHYEGPDRRGIDPAIIYSKDCFQLVYSETIPYHDPQHQTAISRDILYAKFFDYRNDTIHCFVNHWPSKYRGELETVEARNCAARIARRKVDSIVAVVPDAKIILMGDFNDTPDSPCINEILGAKSLSECSEHDLLVNLFAASDKLGFEGTLKHQESWMIFDQIIVSKSLLSNESLYCTSSDAQIIHEDCLLLEDPSYHGQKLNRTYLGPSYKGGFSDHLPVSILLRYGHK
jgi:hypothetical protein